MVINKNEYPFELHTYLHKTISGRTTKDDTLKPAHIQDKEKNR